MNDEWPLIDGNEVTLAMWQLTIYLSFYALIISSNFFLLLNIQIIIFFYKYDI